MAAAREAPPLAQLRAWLEASKSADGRRQLLAAGAAGGLAAAANDALLPWCGPPAGWLAGASLSPI